MRLLTVLWQVLRFGADLWHYAPNIGTRRHVAERRFVTERLDDWKMGVRQ